MAMLDTPEQTRGFASDEVEAGRPDPATGYRSFRLGAFTLSRDEYFARVEWPAKGQSRSHLIPVDAFLRAMMRDVAWGFFYGWVNFDHVIGTRNHYGKVDLYAGTFNGVLREAGVDYTERFDTPKIMATFKAVLRDWTNASFDPFAAPEETGSAFGRKHGDNTEAIERFRIATRRMPGLPDDSPLRDDLPVNRQFLDVPQDEPELHPAEGYEGEPACLQPVQVPFAFGRDLEPLGRNRYARPACSARPPRSSSSRCSTVTTGSSGSCSFPTRSSGMSPTRMTVRPGRG